MSARRQTSERSEPRYERRIVLFIDFLGFKELVERTRREPGTLSDLVAAMDEVGRIGENDPDLHRSQRVTQFSDCIVVSYRVEEQSASFWLLNEVAFCVIALVERGFLLRGAITVGDLLHTDAHVVGPAMVAAYELESRVAKYPRVIVDPKLLVVARAARSPDHSAAEEERYVRAFLTRDDDGHDYFDYVSWRSVVEVTGGTDEYYPGYLRKVHDIIAAGLRHENPGILEKYLWLHAKYVAQLQSFANLPAEHGYWRQNPGHREALTSLPDLSGPASTATARIEASRRAAPDR
ncbi:hypothetical protein ACXIT0_03425 [Methylorubrum extorquens]